MNKLQEELRKSLIGEITKLYKKHGTCMIMDKIFVQDLLIQDKKAKPDMQPVMVLNSIWLNDDGCFCNLKAYRYGLFLEDWGGCSIEKLSTDSLFEILNYYQTKKQ